MTGAPLEPPTAERVEWPTVLLVAGWWAALATVVAAHRTIPWFVSVPALALLGGFQFSLQHEAIHGHPTPWRRVNEILVGAPLSLWCPYREYRSAHLAHHASELTVPGVDPESFHVTLEAWHRSGAAGRSLLRANRTLAGRLVLGPWMSIAAAIRTMTLRSWAVHAPLALAVAWLVLGMAGLPAWEYALGMVWGGTACTLLRSFAEHRYTGGTQTASAVVRSNPAMALLYLNNNLHHTHHARPGAAWYRLPQLHRELGSDQLACEGAGWYRGYADVARRYLVRSFGDPVHPTARAADR